MTKDYEKDLHHPAEMEENQPDPTLQEDDAKRADTNIKSACGDEPLSEENRNPLIPEDASCDLVEPRDPKAPPQADPAFTGVAGARARENAQLREYDERIGTWGGPDTNVTPEDRRRARTDITPGGHPMFYPDAGQPRRGNVPDPKAPPRAARYGAGRRAPRDPYLREYDERMSSWGGPDTNVTPEDRRRARTDITPGGHPMFYPDAGQPREGNVPDPKAPPRGERYGAGRQAPRDPYLREYDERIGTWGGPDTNVTPEDRRRARTDITPGGHPMFYPDAGQPREGNVPDPKAPPRGERYGAGRHAPMDDPYLQDYDERIGTWGGEEGGISSERLDIEIKKRVYPMVENAIEGFRDRFFQKEQDPEEAPEKPGMDFDSDAFNFDPHVVEKITAQTIQGIDGVLGLHSSFFDGITHRFADTKSVPGVQAKVAKDMVRIRLKLILNYEAEKEEVFNTIKDKLAERISSMCGLTLQALQIDVADIMTQEEYDAQNEQ